MHPDRTQGNEAHAPKIGKCTRHYGPNKWKSTKMASFTNFLAAKTYFKKWIKENMRDIILMKHIPNGLMVVPSIAVMICILETVRVRDSEGRGERKDGINIQIKQILFTSPSLLLFYYTWNSKHNSRSGIHISISNGFPESGYLMWCKDFTLFKIFKYCQIKKAKIRYTFPIFYFFFYYIKIFRLGNISCNLSYKIRSWTSAIFI